MPERHPDPGRAVDRELGEQTAAVMRLMWSRKTATVREVLDFLRAGGRTVAYTTVMTVMSRLAEKGLLARELRGNAYTYRAAQSEQEFLRGAAARRVQALVEEFGDLAVAQFLSEVTHLPPERRRQLELLARGEEP